MKTITDVRPSSIAGRWYPANPHELAASVDAYLAEANLPQIEGDVVGVMAPHAGHLYSGPVAGYAFSALRGLNPQVVAVVSPMHYPYPYRLLTSAHSAYQTPLGTIQIDRELIQALNAILELELGYGLKEVANDPEHSLEIELPFLQRALAGDFHLLPLMVADPSRQVMRALGEALAQVLRDRQAILVASTDLSHFYPQALADQLDAEMLAQVAAFNPEGVLQAEEDGRGFACGRAALAAVLWAAKGLGADTVKVLHHATSGDVTGDYSQVVGYGAAVITRHG
jgi:hypothetical protein